MVVGLAFYGAWGTHLWWGWLFTGRGAPGGWWLGLLLTGLGAPAGKLLQINGMITWVILCPKSGQELLLSTLRLPIFPFHFTRNQSL